MKKRLVALCGILFSSMLSAQPVSTEPAAPAIESDKWRFSVTPYVWALGASGKLSYRGNSTRTVKINPGDVMSHVNFAAMVEAEAHKGNFGVYVDAVYADLSSNKTVVVGREGVSANTSLDVTMVTLAPTYTLQNTPALYLDGLLGARMFWQNAKTNFSATQTDAQLTTSTAIQVVSPIVGLKGRWNLGDSKFFVPFYVDAGGGPESSFTSQAYLGIGRAFDWGDVSLVAKNVYYQIKPNKATVDMNMFGAALAVTFRF